MNLSKAFKAAILLAGSLLVAACGGGGGSGNDSGFNPPGISVTASAASNSVATGSSVNVTVNVRQANGAAIQDGTQVNGVVTPGNVGSLVGIGPSGPTTSATAQTVGGVANFRFTGLAAGAATVTLSVPDPNAPARNVTATVTITVTPAPPPVTDRIIIEAESDTVASGQRVGIVVRVRRADGSPVADGTNVNSVVSPAGRGSIVGIGATGSNGTSSAQTVGGIANFRFTGISAGNATVTFSANDPDNEGQVLTESTVIAVTDSGIDRLVIDTTAESVQSRQAIGVVVTARRADGSPIADGTAITGVVAPAERGSLVAIGPSGPLGNATASSVGGIANFRFTGGSVGEATLTFSLADPDESGASLTDSATLQVTEGDERLSMVATTTSLPINLFSIAPFLGSPYMAEVTITLRNSNGELVNAEGGVQVSVNPVGDTGGFSTLDDPTTADRNEFTERLGQGPVDVVAGKATVFMHSLSRSGVSTMTVTGQDPVTNETLSTTLVFEIVAVAPPLPGNVGISPSAAPQYVQGSGGNTSGQFEIQVADGAGQPVPNPTAGNEAFNNLRIELVGDANGARLSGLGADGEAVEGTSVAIRTTNGVAGVVLISGDRPGNVQLRATADRADNNVDNGISDAVTGTRTVAISDGVLFDVDITQPITNALVINPVDPGATTAPGTIPPSPDGTYSITVAAIATDRLGNPVLPGTTLNFGLIDEPQATGFGDFFLSGIDGDAQEAGTLFTSLSGGFATRGGGAGPGDALVIFGEEVVGNRDHESMRRIASIQSETTLTVERPFNPNNTTGNIVDDGAILPYVIGRAADGNITASAITNEFGVARVQMTYPVSKLGKRVIVWAQGDGAQFANAPKTVADVEASSFAGVAPATLIVSPSSILGNGSTPISACVFDRLGSPIAGVTIGFSFAGLDGGIGRVDGVEGAGSMTQLTGFDGCANGVAETAGITSTGGRIDFAGAGATAAVTIEIGDLALIANPSAFYGAAGGRTTLTLLDGTGRRIAGRQIVGECSGSGGAIVRTVPTTGESGITNAQGQARFDITAFDLNQIGGFGTGACTYTVVGGAPSTTVTLTGIDLCEAGISPPQDGCVEVRRFVLTLNLEGAGAGTSAIATSAPGGINCTKPDGASQVCVATFDEGNIDVSVTPQPNDAVNGARRVTFTQGCTSADIPAGGDSGPTRTARVVLGQNTTCTATIDPPLP